MKVLKNILKYIIAISTVIISTFPIVWIISASIKTRLDLFARPPAWIFNPTLDSWKWIFEEGNAASHLLNTTIVVSCSTLLALFIGSLAAYSFARFKFRGSDNLIFWIISTRMFPPISIIIPFYIMMKTLHLLDKHLSLIIVYTIFNIPLVVWMMRASFQEIPIDIEESAMLDGLSTLGVFRRIAIPLGKIGLLSSAILCIILTANEFMFAFILTSISAKTIPVATLAYVGARGTDWGKTAASATTLLIPMIILFLFVQKQFVKGLTFGAVK